MTKHTPGPWYVIPNPDDDGFGHKLFPNEEATFGSCYQTATFATLADCNEAATLHNVRIDNHLTTEQAVKAMEMHRELVAALNVVTPKQWEDNAWWCPNCEEWIPCATNGECCTDCGLYLGDVQPDKDWWDRARALLARAEEEGETS